MITIRIIEDDAERLACYQLRYHILREPWGQPRGSETDQDEKDAILLGAFDEEARLIGTARLQYNNPQQAQIRYMAVRAGSQGRGVGKKLDKRACEIAASTGHREMVLHARENALDFYRSCGYDLKEKSYLLFDSIQHFFMSKELSVNQPPTTE